MASIKVTYGQTSRKFTIASDSTWKEFESQLHHLFDIPNETSISVSYIDEDGDVITLSTDSELHQILSDQELFGANVKFNVYTSENPDNNNNGWILEDAEGKDDSVVTLSDDDESTSNKVDEIVAYKIGEPNEPNENENENTETDQVTNVQTEEQQPAVEIDYPHVTVTDERDDPLFKPTITNENQSEQPEESLIPVDSVNEEKEQPQESVTGSSNNTEKSSSTSSDENKKEESEESETDPNIIFIISSSPWIQRTYYRPRVNLFEGLLNDYPTYPTYFSHFAKPRYSYITPSCGFRRHPYFGSRRFITSRYNGFGGGLCNLY